MRHIILIATLACATLHAKTPEEAVRAYTEEVRVGGLSSIAGLMHPDELAKFRAMMSPVIDEALKDKEGRAVFGRFADAPDGTMQKQLNPEQFMATFLKCIEAMQPQLSQILKTSSVDVLGHVKEGDVSHVVTRFRTKVQGMQIEKMSVMSTKDYQGTAKLMLSGEVQQMAEVLRARRWK